MVLAKELRNLRVGIVELSETNRYGSGECDISTTTNGEYCKLHAVVVMSCSKLRIEKNAMEECFFSLNIT